MAYINQKIAETLEVILANSKNPPLIILQGDHGPGSMLEWKNVAASNMKERFSILAAYHLPNDGTKLITPDITPVNNFRLLFKHYLGAEVELLENESYFSDKDMLYEFLLLTDEQLN